MKRTILLLLCVMGRRYGAVCFVNNRAAITPSFLRAASSDVTTAGNAEKPTKDSEEKKRVAVLLCPAQFCVPADYEVLFDSLKRQDRGDDAPTIGTCRVAPLPRTEWIKVARSLPSREFLEARLPVHSTLSWYFDAMDAALAEIFATEGPDVSISIVAHSIGGWVARAYLGGLSCSSSAVYRLAQKRFSSFITIGTPHSSPDSALVDQTRGLLAQVQRTVECSPESLVERGIDVTCVGSAGLDGKFLSSNVEEIVAASSYLPLLGRMGSKGDGIVPADLAFMSHPARKVLVDQCTLTGKPVRHAHVLPTPWNLLDGSSPSITLPKDFAWYGSDGVLPQWAKYVR